LGRKGVVMREYLKVLCDDLKTKIDNNSRDIEKIELINTLYKAIIVKLNEALRYQGDTPDKIKKFINELEHNIQVDKADDEALISGVSCDYVIERLKDIIK
jgi:hypothetical protein